jgi:hypothetical protein
MRGRKEWDKEKRKEPEREIPFAPASMEGGSLGMSVGLSTVGATHDFLNLNPVRLFAS